MRSTVCPARKSASPAQKIDGTRAFEEGEERLLHDRDQYAAAGFAAIGRNCEPRETHAARHHSLLSLLLPALALAQDPHGHGHDHGHGAAARPHAAHAHRAASPSPYAGMETRDVKSLSGGGRRRAAPRRGLGARAGGRAQRGAGSRTPPRASRTARPRCGQVEALEAIFAEMQAEAKAAGERFIAAEAAIEAAFRDGDVDPRRLRGSRRCRERARGPSCASSTCPAIWRRRGS